MPATPTKTKPRGRPKGSKGAAKTKQIRTAKIDEGTLDKIQLTALTKLREIWGDDTKSAERQFAEWQKKRGGSELEEIIKNAVEEYRAKKLEAKESFTMPKGGIKVSVGKKTVNMADDELPRIIVETL